MLLPGNILDFFKAGFVNFFLRNIAIIKVPFYFCRYQRQVLMPSKDELRTMEAKGLKTVQRAHFLCCQGHLLALGC